MPGTGTNVHVKFPVSPCKLYYSNTLYNSKLTCEPVQTLIFLKFAHNINKTDKTITVQ